MKKPDRGPAYRWDNGVVMLREIKRPDLVKDPYRVRGQYTKEDGRPGTFDAMNWPAAKREADKIKNDLEEGRAARSKSPTFERVWNEWEAMREEEDWAPDTRRNDKDIGRYLRAEFGRKRIDTIVPIDAERWLKALAKSQRCTAEMCQIKLGQVFKFARRKKYLTVNPLLDDPIKLPPRDHERPWVPSWDQMDCIIERGQQMRPANVNGYSRLAWSNTKVGNALGGGAGLRISEAVALPWDRRPGDDEPCVDFANRVLHVHWACTSRGDFDRPKKKKIRDVPMTQWVYDALFEHMHVLQTLGITLEGPVIYNSRNPGRPCTPDQWGVKLRKFLVQAGVLESADQNGDWHFHVLRRFYISARYALGHRELDILESVAHEDSKVTKKHYARALPEPTPIWRHRFQDAEPDDQPTVIDGIGAVVDGLRQLPAPDSADINAAQGLPDWVREAVRHLEGGWKVKDVCALFHKSRAHIAATFRKLGLRPPFEIYHAALERRFEHLHNEGVPPVDIATRTGVTVNTFYSWRQTREAGVPNTGTSLERLRKSLRHGGSVTTDAKQMQLSMLEMGSKSTA